LFFNAWRYEQEPAHISIPLILEILLKLYEKNKDQIDRSYSNRKHNFKERLSKVISGLSMKTTFGVPNLASIDIGYDFSKAQEREMKLKNFDTQLEIYRLEHTKVYEGIDLIVNLVGNPKLVGHGRNNGVKLVVFIDDLDRCKPEKAAEIFEFIKVFLDIPGIVFILGLSDKVIERALRERYRYLEGDFSASDYVKKIVQLPVDIPLWVLTLGGEFGRNHVTTMHSPQAWGWG
jgi:predicted KAP-like P-loop ATPase